MNLLPDTHAVIWWFSGDEQLSRTAHAAIDNDDTSVFVSAASVYEMLSKHKLGKLALVDGLELRFTEWMAEEGFQRLHISIEHALAAARMDFANRDPLTESSSLRRCLSP